MQSDGKVVIGGAFGSVAGAARGRVARLNSDGSTDLTFMNGMSGANDVVQSLAVQADGKVVIVGNFTSVNGVTRNRIARLNTDGSLDTTFQNGMSGASSTVLAVAVQEDGRVLIGGVGYDASTMTVNGVRRDGIARLNPDGSLDTTFRNGMSGVNSNVNSIAVQADGRVLLVGNFSTINGVHRGYLARLNTDGSLDTTFQNGMSGANSTVGSVAVQADGKVLVGGDFTSINGITRIHLARLNADGSVDTTFQDGMSGPNSYVPTMAVQSDGKVVIGGYFTIVNGVSRNRIARLNTDGSLDTTFQNGMSGISGMGIFSNIFVSSLLVQANGQVLIAGNFTGVNGVNRNRVARLEPDGSMEATSFQNAPGVNGVIRTVAAQSDGKVLIGGDFTGIQNVNRGRIARLNADGSLDTAFQNGMIGTDNRVWTVAVQADGKVLIGGEFTAVNGVSRHYLARLNTDGSLDTTFQNGMSGTNDPVWAIVPQAEGKVLIGGSFTTVNGVTRRAIARLNADGSVDVTFQDGMGVSSSSVSVVVQNDGKVLIAGAIPNNVARLNTDGSRDTGFQSPGTNGGVSSLALQADGKIPIGGGFTDVAGHTVSRGSIARLNADGSLDTSFQNGMSGANGGVWAVVPQVNGRVLIAGDFTTVNGVSRWHIARLNADGSLDTTFQDGMSGTDAIVYSLVMQHDGKLLIAGAFASVNGVPSSFVARLLPAALEDCGPLGVPCDDGNACTTNDACSDVNTCVGGPPLACDDGVICTDDSCNPLNGCVHVPRSCHDGNPCTDDGTCQPAVGCVHVPNTLPCDDGDDCTIGDACVNGACVGSVFCDDGDPCTTETCIDRQCEVVGPVDCDDGNACTDDSCHSGSGCVHAPRSCDDANPCTDDGCQPTTGCVHVANDGNPCSDTNACTTGEHCSAGACVSTTPNCSDGDPCTDDWCDAFTGQCLHAGASGCDCGLIAHWSFDDQSDPTIDVQGGRRLDLTSQGTAFTTSDVAPIDANLAAITLTGGSGVADDPESFSFGPASKFTFSLWIKRTATVGVFHVFGKRSSCSTINYQLAFDSNGVRFDSDLANGHLVNLPEFPLNVWTHVAVTFDGQGTLRVYYAGFLVREQPSFGFAGENSAPLKVGASGTCGANFPGLIDEFRVYRRVLSSQDILYLSRRHACDDDNVCTDDSCDSAGSCLHVPVTCDDGDACTTHDWCDGSTGLCAGGPPLDCDDRRTCTTDSCDPQEGCINASVSCDDLDVCTTDFCAEVGGCQHTPIECFDGDACTIDSCDSNSGCQHTVAGCRESTTGGGQTVTTDTEGDGATPADPVETTVATPFGGTVTIDESAATMPPPIGFGLLNLQIHVTAPPGTPADPVRVMFLIDASVLPSSLDILTLEVYKNGVAMAECTGPAGAAVPDPCVSSREITVNEDASVTVLTSTLSDFNFAFPTCQAPFEVLGARVLSDKKTFVWSLALVPVCVTMCCAVSREIFPSAAEDRRDASQSAWPRRASPT